MKKFIFLFSILIFTLSCSKDSDTNRNPYLPTYRFNSSVINLNLGTYTSLRFPGNAISYYEVGVGIRDKVFIINTGSGYYAFDACCPNQELSDCSTMTLDGIKAVCPCDDAEYSLYSGQAEGQQYPMLQYRVEVLSDTSIRVYN